MKLKTKIFIILLTLFTTFIIVLQAQTYKFPKASEIDKRLNYLQRVVEEPLDQNSEILKLGMGSHEWMLFSYSFTTYALTNLAIRDSSYKKRAVSIIRSSIEGALDNTTSSPYGIGHSLVGIDSIPDYSVLYLGHLNLMLGCFRLFADDSSFNDLNDKISKSLFERYSSSKFLVLESYPNSIWIPDNSVALASLKLHSSNTGSNYDSICNKWIDYAEKHYTDEKTGVLFSTINPQTGKPVEEPRGSMLGWSIMFIYQFDSDFAIHQYKNYKKYFSSDFIFLRLFRERHDRTETNLGDIDSGPVFLGFSIPANQFALSNSIIAGDFKTARKLERLINAGSKRITKNKEVKYKVRFIDMNISPMAEALVLHSLTITKWVQ